MGPPFLCLIIGELGPSIAVANKRFDFHSLFKMIQLVGFNPPFSGFHQQLRIVIFIRKKSVERQSNALALSRDFLVANLNNAFSKRFSHLYSIHFSTTQAYCFCGATCWGFSILTSSENWASPQATQNLKVANSSGLDNSWSCRAKLAILSCKF